MRSDASGFTRTPSARTWSRRITQTSAAALVVSVAGFASPAGAHVTVTPSTTTAGAYAVLAFNVGHGCGTSPTTKITVQIPAQITSVTPTRTALWKVAKQTEKVDPPTVDSHGNKIVERVASVSFSTDTPLPDGYRDVLELAVQLPEATGTKLVFPTIQTCEQGESAWTEVTQDGQNAEKLELPAPGFIISAPDESERHHTTTGHSHSGTAAAATPASDRDDALTLAALTIGVLGSVLGGTALVRQRRHT